MVFQRILLALDRTEQAEAVFDQGVEIATAINTQFRLLHCLADSAAVPFASLGSGIALPSGNWPAFAGAGLGYDLHIAEQSAAQWQQTENVAQEWLHGLHQRAVATGLTSVEAACLPGEPGRCICKAAAEWPADLIVVGRHGRSGLEEVLVGSISNYVVHHAPCTVMVVQHP